MHAVIVKSELARASSKKEKFVRNRISIIELSFVMLSTVNGKKGDIINYICYLLTTVFCVTPA